MDKHVCDDKCDYESALKAELNQIYTDFASLKEHNAVTEKAMLEIFAKIDQKIKNHKPEFAYDVVASSAYLIGMAEARIILEDGEKMVKEYFKLTEQSGAIND